MEGGSIKIGNDVSIGQCLHIISGESVIIGDKSTLSANVFISDVDHEYESIHVHVMKQSLKIKRTLIGSNCFIGYGAVIRAGTKLGVQCVVGANSVVKGNFPDYCVIAGNPARIIKKYNSKSQKWEIVK
jgi:acetyltransferase-like isoleucine patch superfamily enzyme